MSIKRKHDNEALYITTSLFDDNHGCHFSKDEVLKVIDYLVSKGANPLEEIIPDHNGNVSYALLLATDWAKVLKILLQSIEISIIKKSSLIKKCFIYAIQNHRGRTTSIDSIKVYLNCGFDINAKISQAIPIISIFESTCGSDPYLILELFIARGVNINAQTCGGKTALIAAIQTKNCRCVKYLVKYVASLDLKDSDNKTALFWAATTKSPKQYKTVKLVLDAGADGRELVSTKTGQTLEQLILDQEILKLIQDSIDSKPLYDFRQAGLDMYY